MSNKPGKVNCQRRKKNTHSTSDFLLRRMGLDSEMEDLWQQKKKTKVEADEKKKKKTKKKEAMSKENADRSPTLQEPFDAEHPKDIGLPIEQFLKENGDISVLSKAIF